MRIVVVEDDPSLSEILRIALKGGGYDVCLAADGETGLAAVMSARTDLVLLDIMLPKLATRSAAASAPMPRLGVYRSSC